MLIITRKPGEIIDIGNEVVVEVLSVDRNQVRIGITAPKKVPIYRREITVKIAQAEAQNPVTWRAAIRKAVRALCQRFN